MVSGPHSATSDGHLYLPGFPGSTPDISSRREVGRSSFLSRGLLAGYIQTGLRKKILYKDIGGLYLTEPWIRVIYFEGDYINNNNKCTSFAFKFSEVNVFIASETSSN